MRDMLAAETVKNLMQPLLDKGFFFEYFYEKDMSGVPTYICRFKKGKEYLDWRESENGKEIELRVYLNNSELDEIMVLNLRGRFPKAHWKFWWKHLFRKAKADEKRTFVAELLLTELNSGNPDFFGIKL